ncbi:MAG: NUDIX hydrolase [Lachnospiraceae bacterium]|nr:NUDIX hydrolase [Lachnospiraceae bacterium]
MGEEFKRLDRELVYKGTVVDFYKDTVQTPAGHIVKWDFIGHRGAAAVVPVREDGKLLMVRQYRNALDRYTLEIPAGGLNDEGTEPTKLAAARELEEETGYRSEDLELLLTLRTTVAFCNEKIDIYLATNLTRSQQNLDEDEFIHVEAYELKELISMILEGVIEDSKTIAAILAYKEKYLSV